MSGLTPPVTPPVSARVNTFLKDDNNIYIDPISKFFLVSEASLGFFRMPFINKYKQLFYLLAVFYVLSFSVFFIFYTFTFADYGVYMPMLVAQTVQYVFCCIFSLFCCSRLQMYYTTLNRFDCEVGWRPHPLRNNLQNLIQALINVSLFIAIFFIPKSLTEHTQLHLLVLHLSYTLEVNYYGHLLNQITPRLKLINYVVESSLSTGGGRSEGLLKDFLSLGLGKERLGNHCTMRKLMDLYHTMVEAYDVLIDAIKWQFLTIIIASFLSALGFTFFLSLEVIKGGSALIESILYQLFIATLVMTPMFSPCTSGDQVSRQVTRLRELLSSRLYENKLDKSSRGVARALLALTETRDLSFRLLRMLIIDISLPFKFVSLLITYLIILLQFDKVINPDK